MANIDLENLKKFLGTPRDWNALSSEERASVLVLSFIGYLARPINIPKDVLERAVEAFNNNRGKVEVEIEAVEKAINLQKYLAK